MYDRPSVKFIWLAVVVTEILAFVFRPRALAALGWLPLFRARLVTPDDSWSAVLRSVDPRGAAYRAPARMDLAPLAGALRPGALSTAGALTKLSPDGRLAVVRAHRFMPFLSMIPFCLVARVSLDDRGSSIVTRVFAYPLFSASILVAAVGSIWFGPTSDTAGVVAICGALWIALEVYGTRPRVDDVLSHLDSLLASPLK